jgi:hypothetical protein
LPPSAQAPEYAVDTALETRSRGFDDVQISTFDQK